MENIEIDTCKLLYNTERVRLYIPEYGRNVQKMVEYLLTVEDREKRLQQAKLVIELMSLLTPHLKTMEDYQKCTPAKTFSGVHGARQKFPQAVNGKFLG